jgi:hypothetical protein
MRNNQQPKDISNPNKLFNGEWIWPLILTP